MNDISIRSSSEWINYIEPDGSVKTYKCHECKTLSGMMLTRRVIEVTDGEHREFKILCSICGHQSNVYRSKGLVEKTWEAEHDPYYEGNKRVVKK